MNRTHMIGMLCALITTSLIAIGAFADTAPRIPETTWAPPGASLSSNGASADLPRIAVSNNGELMAVYNRAVGTQTGEDDPTNPYFRRSTDGGATWSAPAPIATNDETRTFVDVVYDASGTAHVVWIEFQRNSPSDTFTYTLHHGAFDSGAWDTEVIDTVEIDIPLALERAVIVESSPNTVDIVWEWPIDPVTNKKESVFHTRSVNGGAWSTPSRIPQSTAPAKLPEVAADGDGGLNVVWEQQTFDFVAGEVGADVYFGRLRPGQSNWSAAVLISEDISVDATAYRPSIAVSANSLYVVFANRPFETTLQTIYLRTCSIENTNCTSSNDWEKPGGIDPENISGQFVGVNADSPFFVAPELAAVDSNVMLFFHGFPSETENQELIFSTQNCTNWISVARDLVTDFSERSINPRAEIYDGQIHLVYEQVDNNTVYYMTAPMQCGGDGGGGVFLPLIFSRSAR